MKSVTNGAPASRRDMAAPYRPARPNGTPPKAPPGAVLPSPCSLQLTLLTSHVAFFTSPAQSAEHWRPKMHWTGRGPGGVRPRRSDTMPDLERVLDELKQTTRAAMRRRRLANPDSEAWRQADELVHELGALMGELRALLERRRERQLQPVRVRTR